MAVPGPKGGSSGERGSGQGHRQVARLQHRPRASILVARLGCWVLAPLSSTLALIFTLALAFSVPISASFSFLSPFIILKNYVIPLSLYLQLMPFERRKSSS